MSPQKIARGNVADMLSVGIRNELIVLYAVDILILGVKLVNHFSILCGKGLESSRNNGYHKILARLHSFPQKQRKLIRIAVRQKLHVMHDIPLVMEHLIGVNVVDVGQNEEGFAVDYSLVLLGL